MGTSRNDRSPLTPSWKLALAVIGKTDVSPDRQSMEIWRAAGTDRRAKLLQDLSHGALVVACGLVARRVSVHEGLEAYDTAARYESEGGLAIEMGRRALARSLAVGLSTTDFAGELFSEAVSYYVSRDLPSHVAAPGRIQTASDSIQLKDKLRKIARESVRRVGKPRIEGRHWREYVARVLAVLEGKQATQ